MYTVISLVLPDKVINGDAALWINLCTIDKMDLMLYLYTVLQTVPLSCPNLQKKLARQTVLGQTIWNTLYLWKMYIILLLFYMHVCKKFLEK